VSLKLGPNFTDADNLSHPTSQESNRSRQPKNKFSRCLNSGDDVEMDSTATSAKCNRVLHQPGFLAFGPNLRDTDNLSPPNTKRVVQIQAIKKNSSHCSSSGDKGTIDSPSDSDEFGEEVIYSHETPKVDEIIRDFDWELGRFVEYRSPLTSKKLLSLGSNSSHWNINNSSVIDN
jgi:hypothetical protein